MYVNHKGSSLNGDIPMPILEILGEGYPFQDENIESCQC